MKILSMDNVFYSLTLVFLCVVFYGISTDIIALSRFSDRDLRNWVDLFKGQRSKTPKKKVVRSTFFW